MKYFMLSVLSSAVLLFGFSYLYGLTGSLTLPVVTRTLTAAASGGTVSPMAVVAMVLVIAGLAFRLAAVPFHFYAPDVYEGAPTGVVGQLAFIPKVAGFVALGRLLGLFQTPIAELPFDTVHTLIPLTLWVIAAVTMCLGNLLALLQDNLKRLLAYSGIAHGGYMLIGILVACSVPDARTAAAGQTINTGMDSLLFYLVAYGLMTVGAVAILSHLAFGDKPVETVDDLAGLGRTHPVAAAALAVCFFSLIGLPLTAGFYGKFKLFFDAFSAPTATPMKNLYRVIVVLGAVNAAVAAVYYLRVIGVLYLRSPLKPAEPARGYPALVAGVTCAAATLALGLFPQPLMDAARKAVAVPAAVTQPLADAK
jgi:NADH-quinone oxidoreductase subunit N